MAAEGAGAGRLGPGAVAWAHQLATPVAAHDAAFQTKPATPAQRGSNALRRSAQRRIVNPMGHSSPLGHAVLQPTQEQHGE